MAINIDNPDRIIVNVNSDNTIINPFSIFDDSLTTGKIATFDFYEDSFAQDINILLFDQNGDGAPQTVDNFESYVNGGDYDNSIIHRSISNFVVQGGGFTVEDLAVDTVTTTAPVANEFDSNRSNTEGTIAMAKLENLPDSATSQWFFNLSDNSDNLDNQNGGFTVFGKVLSQTDLDAIKDIASVDVFDALTINPAFGSIPLNIDSDNSVIDSDDSVINSDNDYIRLRDVTISQAPELTFTIENNTNPDLVNASLNQANDQIILDYQPGIRGEAQITIEATNLLGESSSTVLNVLVENPPDFFTLEAGTAQIAYVAYYGRPADPGGLNFWNDFLDTNNISYSPRGGDILTNRQQRDYDRFVDDFGTSEEADRIFGNLSIREKVNQVYDFAFNRSAETAGLNFWTEQITNNNVSLASFALEIALGAQKDDIETLKNKIASADLFSQGITDLGITTYNGSNAEIFGRNWLDDIGETIATTDQVNDTLNELMAL